MGRQSLTIELARKGEHLLRWCHFPPEGRLFYSKQRFDHIGAGYQVGAARGLPALAEVLERGQLDEIDRHLAGTQRDQAGKALFEALFGDEEAHWRRILQRASGLPEHDQITPTRTPLRVRILTDDRLLMGLPWRASTWDGHLLCAPHCRWTFELCGTAESSRAIELHAPGRILVIAPHQSLIIANGGADIDTEIHLEELQNLLEHLSPESTTKTQFAVARTLDDLHRIAPQLQPQIVYFYGHGRLVDGQLFLQAGGDPLEWILMRDFVSLLQPHPPDAVFLNGCFTGQAGWHCAGPQLLAHVPFVLANSTMGLAGSARRYAINWFRNWLGEQGGDPVLAAHSPAKDSTRLADWGVAVVHAEYGSWTIHKPSRPRVRKRERPENWFDRDDQRARMSKHVLDLAEHPTQRVEAAIAFGLPGNATESASRQLMDYVERRDGNRLRVHELRIEFPPYGANLLKAKLEDSLRMMTGSDFRPPLQDVLRTAFPSWTPGSARILWLNWNVLRGRQSYGEAVMAWLEFARDCLAPACPRDMSIVSFLSVEALPEAFDALAAGLDDIVEQGEFSSTKMSLTNLPPLGNGKLSDLRKFLGQEEQGCDPGIVDKLARAIFERTSGKYSETLELLRKGFEFGWPLLLQELGGGRTRAKTW